MYILLKLYLITIHLLRCAFLLPSPRKVVTLDTRNLAFNEFFPPSTELDLSLLFYLSIGKSNSSYCSKQRLLAADIPL